MTVRLTFLSRSLLVSLLAGVALSSVVGCGADGPIIVSTEESSGAAVQGMLHGGQSPISGAHIYLMAANTTGYGSPSISLLTNGDGQDSVGYYRLTNSIGSFNIQAGDYTCTAGQQVYALAEGGNPGIPGTVDNTAAQQMAVLGSCPASGTFIGAVTYIYIDEVSTIAAAYSLAGYAVDSTHVSSSGTAAATTGIANAFSTASNLASLTYGYAYGTTPAIPGYSSSSHLSANGTVPVMEINTLANIIASCVNTNSSSSSACTTLFGYAKNPSGVAPTNVADAAINIAHNPTANVANLYPLGGSTPPFSPALSAAPVDWTIYIKFTAPNTSAPVRIAIDGAGDVWIPNTNNNTITELGPNGQVISGTAGYSNSKCSGPVSVGFDSLGDLWVSDRSDDNLCEYLSTGAAKAQFATVNASNYSLTFDSNGYIWVPGSADVAAYNSGGTKEAAFASTAENAADATDGSGTIWAVSYTSASVIHYTSLTTSTSYSPGLTNPTAIAFDSSGNLWISNGGVNGVTKFVPSTGKGTNYTGVAGLAAPYMIAVDGLGNVFTGNENGTISELSPSGGAISGSKGYETPAYTNYLANPAGTVDEFPEWGVYGLAVDGSGNVWATDLDGDIYEYVGLANPVVTPLTYTKLGVRP
jgi:streptogramin lyase